MSRWTYIHAMVEVNFGNQSEMRIREFLSDCKDEHHSMCFDLEKKGRYGCEITGSEKNATIVAEPLRNHVLDPRDRYWVENRWTITVTGNLRDRVLSETKAEWNRFLFKLAWYIKKVCAPLDKLECYDSRIPWAQIMYYFVDINNGYRRYMKTSIDKDIEVVDQKEERK